MATYYEVILKGDGDVTRAYLEGFFRGKGVTKDYAFGDDHAFDLGHIKELVKYHGSVTHLVCTSQLLTAVKGAIKKAPEAFELEIAETHRVRRAYFHFKFKTANRKVAGKLKRLIARLPAGVRTTDYEPKEIVDPGARGAEGYAPVHEYVYKGKGVIEGEPRKVLEIYYKMDENDFIQCDDVVLHRG
jgi:hypothetical protein